MSGILGLEFKDDCLKVLELLRSNGGLTVNRVDKITLPPGSFKEGVILDVKGVAAKISAFIKNNNITATKAVILIDATYVFTKIIRMPHNLSDEQIRLNLEAELSQYRAFTGSEFVLDFKKIEEISEEGVKKINVLFAATPRRLAASYLQALEPTGLDLIAMDLPVPSMIRLLEGRCLDASSLDVNLVILVAQGRLDMCIVKGARIRFLHSVEIENIDFEKNRADFISRLISAIKLVVNFYQARFIQGEEIARILISPQEKKYREVASLLKTSFNAIPIEEASFLQRITLAPNLPNHEELSFSFAPLLGAALRIEGKARTFDLNLLLEQKTKRQYHLNQVSLLFAGLSLVFGIALISLFWVVLNINILSAKIALLNQQLRNPSSQLNAIVAIKEKKSLLDNQVREGSLVIARSVSEDYFKKVAKAMSLVPSDLWLTEITSDEEKGILINGESKTEKPIFEYVSELSASGYYKLVELLSSKAEADVIRFNVRCKLK